jgi:nucleotidyltransferase substrate binding protein (TIGR01987 family)
MIDVSSLSKALATLDTGLAALAKAPDDKFIRDACIQRFEYSYELCHKMLRRYLEASEPVATDQLSFPALIRLGFERGLLAKSWDVWADFRTARNNTSHAYDEAKASAVLKILPDFTREAHFLLAAITSRQAT